MPLTLDEKFANFLESLKVVMQTGNETLDIPVLDPYESDLEEIDIDEPNLKLLFFF